ncbi:MAG: HAMP domain-containing protein [Burkholderiaceae bacterium]|nr:HAMP domain-containing protein [Burkholderiaceae bacterium]
MPNNKVDSASSRGGGGFFAHHGLWSPGVRLFRRLTFRAKAALISVAFMLPIAALATVYLNQSMAMVGAKVRAQQGMAYASEVLPLIQILQEQRRATLQGAGEGASDAVAGGLKRVADVESRFGTELKTAEALSVLRANMEKAATQKAKSPLGTHKRHSQSIDAALALLGAALDGSGLALNSEADASLLIQTGLVQMPRLHEATLATLDAALAVARGADGAMAAKMAAPQRAIALYLDGQVRGSLDKVIAMHEGLAARIAYAPVQEAASKAEELTASLGDEGWKGDEAALLGARQTMVERFNALQGSIVGVVTTIEQDRLERALLERKLLAALLVVAIAGAAYMFASFSRVMQGGLNEVRRHLRAMSAGDLTTSPNPWGRDEAAQLMIELRTMQDSIRDIVNQVRSSSEGIASASRQIAGGAGELSSRTEETAATLQRSASALEQIGTTVRQTAADAGQAESIGRESAAAALRGGIVIEQVNATMQDIRGSASKIGEIIGVIDGIAFQTNILALNAAVEAARAGEAGRGFAVVASEVRSLAQRSAAAAREIKVLVGASIDKVACGVGVVNDASGAMTEIVTAAQRVNGLVDSIAQVVREQAAGVTEVSGSVTVVDSMTQRNAALVEQTAAAAQGLEEQARLLAERVARFKLPATDIAARQAAAA